MKALGHGRALLPGRTTEVTRWRGGGRNLTERDATPERLYLRRREFLALGAAGSVGLLAPARARAGEPTGAALPVTRKVEQAGGESLTSWDAITTYNNFYEFGTDKDDPARERRHAPAAARGRVAIEGEVKKPQVIDIDALLKWLPARGARLPDALRRGLVDGDPLGRLPAGRAGQAASSPPRARSTSPSQTLLDPEQMPGQQRRTLLDWPYVEGLRIDEAMHPLALLAVGLYGERCRTRTARRSGWWCRGSTASRASSRSSSIRFPRQQPPTTWNLVGARRVRLLRQREPGRRPPALEPGAASGASASSSGARRCRSTATARRSPRSTPGLDLRRNF